MTSHEHHNCLEHAPAHSSVHQSLDELEFERGIWSAGIFFVDLNFTKKILTVMITFQLLMAI